MQEKIEGTKNWFEMDDTKLCYTSKDEKIEFQLVITEIRKTKKGAYVINDAPHETAGDYMDCFINVPSSTTLTFNTAWRIIGKVEMGAIVLKQKLKEKRELKSHNELEI